MRPKASRRTLRRDGGTGRYDELMARRQAATAAAGSTATQISSLIASATTTSLVSSPSETSFLNVTYDTTSICFNSSGYDFTAETIFSVTFCMNYTIYQNVSTLFNVAQGLINQFVAIWPSYGNVGSLNSVLSAINLLSIAQARQSQAKVSNQSDTLIITSGYGCFASPTERIGYPLSNSSDRNCRRGFFCPYVNSSSGGDLTTPVLCPPLPDCARLRAFGKTCPPQGLFEPAVCAPGNFCPNQSSLLVCPPGSYCPSGTVVPLQCETLAYCPEGAVSQLYFGGVLFAALIDAALFIWIWRAKILSFVDKSLVALGFFEHTPAAVSAKFASEQLQRSATENEEADDSDNDSFHQGESTKDADAKQLDIVSDAATAGSSSTPSTHTESSNIWRQDTSQKVGSKHHILGVIGGRTSSVKRTRSLVSGRETIGKEQSKRSLRLRGRTVDGTFHTLEATGHNSNISSTFRKRKSRVKSERGSESASNRMLPDALRELVTSWQIALEEAPGIRMDMSFEEISVRLKSGKNILSSVTGTVRSGRMTAIMGPSGCGSLSFNSFDTLITLLNFCETETTLMNVLLGNMKNTSGNIFINSRPCDPSSYRNLIGYVPQADIMLNELTVREIIRHSGRIRRPSNWTESHVDRHVDNIIRVLGLSHVADVPIGDDSQRGISGGQRKRVNVAIELAATPLVLLLDEPTSGLDASSALQLTALLASITQSNNLTTVAVLHQPRPEVFSLFDDVIFLAPGGSVAYCGPVTGVETYFERAGFEVGGYGNVADRVMDVLCGQLKQSRWARRLGDGSRDAEDNGIADLWKRRDEVVFRSRWSVSSMDVAAMQKRVEALVAKEAEESKSREKADGEGDIDDVIGTTEGQNTVTVAEQRSGAEFEKDFYRSVDRLMKGRGSSFIQQVLYCHQRSLIQQARRPDAFILEIFVAMFAGFLMGISLQGTTEMFHGVYIGEYAVLSPSNNDWVAIYGLLLGMAVAMAGAPAGVKVFGEERNVYWREASSGHSQGAYYLGKTISTFYRFILSSLHFAAVYCIFARPMIDFGTLYGIVLLLFWGTYGLATIVSTIVRRENMALLGVVVGLFAAVFCGFGPTLTQAAQWNMKWLWHMSFNKWAAEAHYSASMRPYYDVYDVNLSAGLFGYSLNQVSLDFAMMFIIGIVLRFIGFFLLIFMKI